MPLSPKIDEAAEVIDYAGVVILWILVGLLVAYLVNRYSRPDNHPLVFVSTWLGWLFPFLIVILLPMDITISMYQKCKLRTPGSGFQSNCVQPLVMVDEAFLWAAWRTIYWTSFCLTMFVLPMLQAYCDSGYFTAMERLKKAVRVNIIYYSILGLIGVIGLIVLFTTFHPEKDSVTRQQAIVGLLMALSNLYGLSLSVVFLAFGLVHVPRNIWHLANRRRCLRQLESSAPEVRDAMTDAVAAYNDLVKEVFAISDRLDMNHELRPYLNVMLEKCPPLTNNVGIVSPSSSEEITPTSLTQLHKNLIRALSEKMRREWEWSDLCRRAFFLQDVISNENNTDMRFKSIVINDNEGKFRELLKFFRWIWHLKLFKWFVKGAALIFGLISIVIIWSETTSAFKAPNNTILSIIGIIFNAPNVSYTTVEFLSLLIMFYICSCAIYSLFRVKVFNIYSLHPDKQTGNVSMCWFTSYVCKLTFPLSYNFMTMTMVKSTEKVKQDSDPVFSKLMGVMDLAPVIGDRFQVYVPILVVVICFLNAFDVFGKISRLFGFGEDIVGIEDKDIDDTAGNNYSVFLEDGRLIVAEARTKLERQNGSLADLTDVEAARKDVAIHSDVTPAANHSKKELKREFRADFVAKNPLYEKYQRKFQQQADDRNESSATFRPKDVSDTQPLIKKK